MEDKLILPDFRFILKHRTELYDIARKPLWWTIVLVMPRKCSHEEGRYKHGACVPCAIEYQKKYRQDNAAELRVKKRAYEVRVKLEGVTAYGGRCSCCGESQIEFLTIEHLNGPEFVNGRRLKAYRAWARAKKLGWPSSYTVLCFNCNCAKGIYGTCPHYS